MYLNHFIINHALISWRPWVLVDFVLDISMKKSSRISIQNTIFDCLYQLLLLPQDNIFDILTLQFPVYF